MRYSASGRRGSGSFGSDRTAGYAIGEDRTSPWLEAIAGIRERSCPRLGSKPVPAPRTRPEVWCGLRHGFSPAVPATQAPFRAPENVVRVNPFLARCAGQGVRAGCAGQFSPVSPATARAAAKQQPSSAATAHGQRSATARPENLCRARHVGHREEALEDEILHVRLDVDNPEARQHHGIGTAKTSVAAANSCCTGQHRRAATSARR